ncbi:ATP-binding protein, partial [Streptomyces sp. NPDC055039]
MTVPLLPVAVALCAATVIWRIAPELVTVGHVLIGVGSGLLTALLMGRWRARVASRTVCRAQAQGTERLLEAIKAVDTCGQWSVAELRLGNTPQVPPGAPFPYVDNGLADQAFQNSGVSPDSVPFFTDVENALTALQAQMVSRVIEAHEQSQLAVRHVMFRHIAKREHLLIMNLLNALEALQGQVKAAGLLNQLFKIDNMAVRVRRMVDNFAILGGESASAVRRPVTVTNVLRSSIQSVEQYERARLVTGSYDPDLALPGHVAPDVTNLVSELVENATRFSPPTTWVLLRVEMVAAGLVVEVTDRGETPPRHLRDQANALLASPHLADVSAQLADGRLGLLVVGMTAQRHHIHVTLNRNAMGGTTAIVVIPSGLLVTPEPEPVREFATRTAAPGQARPVPAPRPAPPAAPAASTAGGLPRRRGPQRAAALGDVSGHLPP